MGDSCFGPSAGLGDVSIPAVRAAVDKIHVQSVTNRNVLWASIICTR